MARLQAVADVVGTDALLMVDANEAWSPKEAIRRAHAYRDAGFNIYWIEDPCLRDDFAGLARICEAVPFAHINSGEYLDLHGKVKLMEARAVDILNVHGHISDTLAAARIAAEYGIPVSLGNTPFELGVHLAAALPEAQWMEYSFQDYDCLIEAPVQFVDGYAIAPDRPGHGLSLSEAARREFARPNAA
jgi:L-alanine-DL-glutamate epimerase-like enolase superfamily enzyme